MLLVVRLEKSLTWSGHKLQGRTEFQGLKISIENRAGTYRRGVDPDGHPWKTKLNYDYGYIRESIGVDGDHVDCFIGPHRDSETVFIVHQVKPGTDTYDEDKVLLGFRSAREAKAAYLSNYDRTDMFGSMDEVSISRLRDLLRRYKGERLSKAVTVFPIGTIRKHRDGWRQKTPLGWKRINAATREVQRAFLNGVPIARVGTSDVPVGKTKQERVAWAWQYIQDNTRTLSHESDLGTVAITKNGIKESVWHYSVRTDLATIKILPAVLSRGMALTDFQLRNGRALIAAPVSIDGTQYLAVVVIRQSGGENRFHIARTFLKKRTQAAHNPNRTMYDKEAPPGSIKRVLQDTLGVKFREVSE